MQIRFDAKINQYVGFTLPLSKNGTPEKLAFPATSTSAICKYLESAEKSSYLYVIMVVVMDDTVKVPPFCLSAWGTNNKFTAEQVHKRTIFVIQELKKHNVDILGFSSDGDSRLLKAQKQFSGLGIQFQDIPLLFRSFYYAKIDMPLFSVQDVVHLINKLKNRIFKASFPLIIGNALIPVLRDLEMLIQRVPRGVHGLSLGDLDPSDKMNAFKAIKISQVRVEKALSDLSKTETEGTRLYLRVMRYVYESFTRTDLSVNDRLGMSWYATFILRGWKQFNSANEFVSNNVYECQELNCHNLTAIVHNLRNKGESDEFCPNKMQSQTCEQTFRHLRSLSTSEMTETNFDTKDALSRIHRIALKHDAELFLKENGFSFPRMKQITTGIETLKYKDLPDDNTIGEIIQKSKEKALNHLKHFGVTGVDLSCKVNPDLSFECSEDEQDENEMENLYSEQESVERNDCDDPRNDELIRLCEGIAQNSNESSIRGMFTLFKNVYSFLYNELIMF